MQVAYFDSSALLSILLQDAGAGVSADLWSRFSRRVSSILLNAECWNGMRRHFARIQMEPKFAWLEERSDFLSAALASVHVLPVDERILGILRERAELSECRPMDALHLATALHFSEGSDAGLVAVSLDEQMRQTARKLKLEILPA